MRNLIIYSALACLVVINSCKSRLETTRSSKLESLSHDESARNVFFGVFDSSPNLQPLPGVEADFDGLPDKFSNQKIGFVPRKIFNQPYSEVIKRSKTYAEFVGENGTLIWYFSGHGERNGKLLMEGQFRDFSEIAQAMMAARNNQPFKRLVVILDSCYSGDMIDSVFQGGSANFPASTASQSIPQPTNAITYDELTKILKGSNRRLDAQLSSHSTQLTEESDQKVITVDALIKILNSIESPNPEDNKAKLTATADGLALVTLASVAAAANINIRAPERSRGEMSVDDVIALLHSNEVPAEVNNSVPQSARLADELIIFTATQSWETASDGSALERRGGRFTSALIDNLNSAKTSASIEEFFQATAARVQQLNKFSTNGKGQTPKWLVVPDDVKKQKFLIQSK